MRYNYPMNIADIKKEFPIFDNYPDLVYLDSAASAHKPRSVISAELDFYSRHNANVHRGIYDLSEEATELYESARDIVAGLINANREEIIFTSGTTDSLNGLANSLQLSGMLNSESKIAVSELEHHANMLPWQRLSKSINYLPLNAGFTINFDGTENADLIAVSQISNVTGTLTDIKSVREKVANGLLVVDAAQSVSHMPIDVQNWAADFVAFSGHKLYGPTGVGILYGKKDLLEKMEPFRVGGGMISEVNRNGATWAELPAKFEAGTPQIAQAVGLGAAIKFLQQFSWQEIQDHEQSLRKYAISQLQTILGINIFHPNLEEVHGAVISFAIDGLHAHDISQVLSEHHIAVRAGHHCTHILHREVLKVAATIRVSFGIYNDESDIDKLIVGLNQAIKTLQ